MGRAVGELDIYCTIKKHDFVILEESKILRFFQNDKIIFRCQNLIKSQNSLALMGTASFFVIAGIVDKDCFTSFAMTKKI